MPKGSPFGPNLRALVIYLRFTQGIAFERLATLLSDLRGLDISEGALVNILDAAKDAFAKATAAIRARLLDGTILQSDETGLRVGKQNWWLWVFHHDDSALFVAAPSRAKKVVENFLGDFRPDFWVSDRYGGQMGWASVNNQVCLAHLIRDVQYAIDAGDDIFAPELRHLLGRACRIGRRRKRLADATLKTYAARLNARLDELMRLTLTHEAGVKLQRMIKRTRQYLFVFVTNRDVPATNNGSERALRPCAVFRKITNGFRTEWGGQALRRHPLRHRNRPPPFDRSARSNPSHPHESAPRGFNIARRNVSNYLTPSQEDKIRKLICDKRPEQLKMDFALWTRSAVMLLIERECAIKLSVRAVGNYLKR
jgi:transposase